jgi:hypothetical protein
MKTALSYRLRPLGSVSLGAGGVYREEAPNLGKEKNGVHV